MGPPRGVAIPPLPLAAALLVPLRGRVESRSEPADTVLRPLVVRSIAETGGGPARAPPPAPLEAEEGTDRAIALPAAAPSTTPGLPDGGRGTCPLAGKTLPFAGAELTCPAPRTLPLALRLSAPLVLALRPPAPLPLAPDVSNRPLAGALCPGSPAAAGAGGCGLAPPLSGLTSAETSAADTPEGAGGGGLVGGCGASEPAEDVAAPTAGRTPPAGGGGAET